jgi:hypothetical protein
MLGPYRCFFRCLPMKGVAASSLIVYLLINLLFRVRAATGERLARREEGAFMFVALRFCIVAAVLLYGLAGVWLLGLAMASASGLAIAMSVIAFALFSVRTRTEEALLIDRYGDEYRDYLRTTGRFFPNINPGYPNQRP